MPGLFPPVAKNSISGTAEVSVAFSGNPVLLVMGKD